MEKRMIELSLLCRMIHRTKAQAFLTWKSDVQESRAQQARSRKVIMRLYQRRLAQAFSGFVQAVQARRDFRQRLECVCVKLQNATLARAWQEWIERVAVKRERRAKLAAAVKRMKNLVLVQVRSLPCTRHALARSKVAAGPCHSVCSVIAAQVWPECCSGGMGVVGVAERE